MFSVFSPKCNVPRVTQNVVSLLHANQYIDWVDGFQGSHLSYCYQVMAKNLSTNTIGGSRNISLAVAANFLTAVNDTLSRGQQEIQNVESMAG
jgi:hypothetical protein